MNLKFGLPLVAATIALAGCVSGGGGSAISLDSPGFALARVDVSTGTISGAFNPAGYSDAQMRRLVGSTCLGSLASFGATDGENGLRNFSASCSGGYRDGARAVEFERTPSGPVIVEITGASAGNLTYNSYEISV